MRYIILILAVLSVFFTSCGNIEDSDGKIGNEQKETANTENAKDKAEKIADDVKDRMEDMTDKMNGKNGSLSANNRLTTDHAQSVALRDAGYDDGDVTFYKTYLHSMDGRVYYEVEFSAGEKMYGYEIDSLSGDVLKREESVVR